MDLMMARGKEREVRKERRALLQMGLKTVRVAPDTGLRAMARHPCLTTPQQYLKNLSVGSLTAIRVMKGASLRDTRIPLYPNCNMRILAPNLIRQVFGAAPRVRLTIRRVSWCVKCAAGKGRFFRSDSC